MGKRLAAAKVVAKRLAAEAVAKAVVGRLADEAAAKAEALQGLSAALKADRLTSEAAAAKTDSEAGRLVSVPPWRSFLLPEFFSSNVTTTRPTHKTLASRSRNLGDQYYGDDSL